MNKCINHNIRIYKYCENPLIIVLEAACGNRLKCLLEYEKFNSDLWTGPFIDVGFERKFQWTIYFDPTLNPKYTNEPNVALIITMSLILIYSLLKY